MNLITIKKVDPDAFKDIQVVETIKEGKTVYLIKN
jgi:predicted amidohydrolase YtcJ